MSDVSRRDFVKLAAALPCAAAELAPAEGAIGSSQPPAPPPVDQNPIRRRGVGLRGLDAARAWPGLTLFAPAGLTETFLIDLHGTVVHSWKMPYRPGLYGYLTDRGTLFYNGQIPNETFLGKQPFMGGAVLEMDWNGRILWELKRPDHHHDGRLLRNGNVILLCGAELPDDVARRVRGGRAGSEIDRKTMWSDFIVEATTDGRVVWEWKAWEHLDPAVDAPTAL